MNGFQKKHFDALRIGNGKIYNSIAKFVFINTTVLNACH